MIHSSSLALAVLPISVWLVQGSEDVGCLLSLVGNERYSAGTLVEGNCGFDFSMGLPADAPNCPRTLPIALVLVPKCASVSFLNWVAMLDGTTQKWVDAVDRFESLSKEFCLFISECPTTPTRNEQFINSIKLISMLNNGQPPRGTRDEIASPEGLAEVYVRFGRWVRDGILPYPQDCIRCCAGEGRLPVVVLRNPLARLMAYFQRAWLKNAQKPLNLMTDFPAWVQALEAVHASGAYMGALQRGEGVSVQVRGQPITFDVQDLYHTRPASHLLASLFPEELADDLQAVLPSCPPASCWWRRRIFAIRTESVGDDLELLLARLCLQLGRCDRVPPVLHLNTRSSGQRLDGWSFWHSAEGAAAVQRLRAMYADDFVLGHYAANVSAMAPLRPSAAEVQSFVERLASGHG